VGFVEEAKSHTNSKNSYRITGILLILLVALIYLLTSLKTVEAQPKQICLIVNGLATQHTTTCKTVGDFLDQNYQTNEDIVSVFPNKEKELIVNDKIYIETKPSDLNEAIAININEAVKTQKAEEKRKEEEINPEPKSPTYQGTATWYKFGEKLTAASTQFPRGTKVRVVAIDSGKHVDVVINDYGPEAWTGVNLDLNSIAFSRLAPLWKGKIPIKYYVI
jgi:rare lipoprotein A (peptidoglycan hydrolase)